VMAFFETRARTGASPLVLPRSRTHAALPEASSGGDAVRILLHVTEIDHLVRLGFLSGEQCQDPEALQVAVMGLTYGVLDRAA
jgi:hypothetical protein